MTQHHPSEASGGNQRQQEAGSLSIRVGQIIRSKKVLALQEMLDEGMPLDTRVATKHSTQSMLTCCVMASSEHCLDLLLERGADLHAVNKESKDWDSLLQLAVMRRDAACAKVLLRHGQDVNVKVGVRNGNLAHLAAGSGNVEMLDLLAGHGLELRHQNTQGNTALHLAIFSGQACSWLIAREPSLLNIQDDEGKTPLMKAIQWQKVDMALWLLDHDQDLSLQNREGHTALEMAAANNLTAVVQRLEAIEAARRSLSVISRISGLVKQAKQANQAPKT